MAAPTCSPTTVTVETFAKDLWEALRTDLREKIGTAISPKDFDDQVPTWDKLTVQARRDKIESVRNDLLHPVTRAGYEIRRRAE